jgi:hypothetical protein
MIEQAGAIAVGGIIMIKKALFEELIIHVDKEELARLLDIEPGFEVQNIEEQGKEFRLAQIGFQGVDSAPPRESRSPCIGLLCRLLQWAILTR